MEFTGDTGVMAAILGAAANAIRDAALSAYNLAASIREASMSKDGRKEHLKKIQELKIYLATSEHSALLSDDAQWKHGVNVVELGQQPHAVEKFFLSLKPKRKGTGVNVKSKDSNEVIEVKGLAALKKYRASVTFLFTENCVQPSAEYQLCMSKFFKGLGNIDAADTTKPKAKKAGKEPLSYTLYVDILRVWANEASSFMVLFLITTWNLICRGKQTSEIALSQLGVCNDAITIEFSGTKTDTDGQTANTKEPRHCYANPHNWRTCIVTWLGIFFLCNPMLHTSSMAAGAKDCKLFPSADAKNQFAKNLQRDKAGTLAAVFTAHGVFAALKNGVHSIRKGAATCVAAASTSGPSMVHPPSSIPRAASCCAAILAWDVTHEIAASSLYTVCVAGGHMSAVLLGYWRRVRPISSIRGRRRSICRQNYCSCWVLEHLEVCSSSSTFCGRCVFNCVELVSYMQGGAQYATSVNACVGKRRVPCNERRRPVYFH